MLNYIKKYLVFLLVAALFMVLEVTMDLLQPNLMRKIVDEGVLGLANNVAGGDFSLIIKLGSIMVVIAIVGCLCGSLNNVFVNYSSQNIGNLMRKDIFSKILSLSFLQIDKLGTGALITRITNDISQVEMFISMFVRGMVRTGFMLIGSLICMFHINTDFGYIAIITVPFIFGTCVFAIKKVEPLFLIIQEGLDLINSILQEDIAGIRIIKASVKETYEKLRFGKANDALIAKQLKILILISVLNPIANFFMYLGVAIIIWNGGKSVAAGTTTPGSIMAAITYTTQLLHSILMMVGVFQTLSRGMTSWRRISDILAIKPELTDGPLDEESPQKQSFVEDGLCSKTEGAAHVMNGDSAIQSDNYAVEFKDVSFDYLKEEPPILSNINLSIKKGETIAIMGATGCGKSSLVSLIPRFYDVDSGQVLIDGKDVKDYQIHELRDKIAFVLQKSELFSDTIEGNIKWGKPEASREEIINAASIAQADSFINNIPDAYENVVAERGMSLSGGQRQRISISRAVLKSSDILVLDDSSSALDLKTESNFYEALNKAKPNCTKIIIAQRIASVRRADRIVVLENGTISACGSHEELLKSCDIYKDIYRSQLGEEVQNG